jgi:hypothetical protein
MVPFRAVETDAAVVIVAGSADTAICWLLHGGERTVMELLYVMNLKCLRITSRNLRNG